MEKLNNKPYVFITRMIPDEALAIIAEYCDYEVWEKEDVPVPEQVLMNRTCKVDGLLTMLTDKVTDEHFMVGRNLKVVANMAVGFDNIDISAAQEYGITVTNTPDVLTDTTADLTFALLLSAARRIPEANNYLKQGFWCTWSPMLLTGVDVYGKTIGIVGMGRIGQAVARRALGFNMMVNYYAPTPKDLGHLPVSFKPLEKLLSSSDFVCVLAPMTEKTKHLIGERELALMKPSSVLINTARGPVVDEKALYNALLKKQIWAAGLDVFEDEPISPDHPLVNLPNVVATPHIGSASIETRTKMAVLAAQNLVSVLTGNPPLNKVV